MTGSLALYSASYFFAFSFQRPAACHPERSARRRIRFWDTRASRRTCRSRSDLQQLLLRLPRRHLWTRLAQIDVDLAANTKPVRQVDTRLHGETDAGNQRALVRGLEVVDMRSRAVQIAIDRMPRAMHEVLAQSGRADHGARGVVDCRAGHRLVLLPTIPEQRDGGIASPPHGLPHASHLRARLPSGEPHPHLIGKDAAGRHTGPQV